MTTSWVKTSRWTSYFGWILGLELVVVEVKGFLALQWNQMKYLKKISYIEIRYQTYSLLLFSELFDIFVTWKPSISSSVYWNLIRNGWLQITFCVLNIPSASYWIGGGSLFVLIGIEEVNEWGRLNVERFNEEPAPWKGLGFGVWQ